MGDILRRRGMMTSVEVDPYPYQSNYPSFSEYGLFGLTPVEGTSSSNTNCFIKSGTTNYTYVGGDARNRPWRIEITETSIIVYRYYADEWVTWKTKTFAGFPVKIKKCSGGEGNAPTVTFIQSAKLSVRGTGILSSSVH